MRLLHRDTTTRLAVRVADAAKMLDVSRSTMYKLIQTGQIPSVRVGDSLRVPVAAIERLLDPPADTDSEPERAR